MEKITTPSYPIDWSINGKITKKPFRNLISQLIDWTWMTQIDKIPENRIETCKDIILSQLPEGWSFSSSCELEWKIIGEIVELGEKKIYTVTKEEIIKYNAGLETLERICTDFWHDHLPNNKIHILFLVEEDSHIYNNLIYKIIASNHHGRWPSARWKWYDFEDLFSHDTNTPEKEERISISIEASLSREELYLLLKK